MMASATTFGRRGSYIRDSSDLLLRNRELAESVGKKQ